MKLSNITGIIKRRILVNYRVAPEVMQPLLPLNFRPKLHNGSAIAGICLIRLEQVRPKGIPGFLGISSENAAHRIAVIWKDEQAREQEGVYITRRDTNSRLNHAVGGRFFPGEHHAAKFQIADDGKSVDFEMKSDDDSVLVQVRGKESNQLGQSSKFENVEAASTFFESGSLGYSATVKQDRLEGLRLVTTGWKVTPLEISHVHSSFFADQQKFPEGSVSFDCALIMRDIQHEWRGESDLLLKPVWNFEDSSFPRHDRSLSPQRSPGRGAAYFANLMPQFVCRFIKSSSPRHSPHSFLVKRGCVRASGIMLPLAHSTPLGKAA